MLANASVSLSHWLSVVAAAPQNGTVDLVLTKKLVPEVRSLCASLGCTQNGHCDFTPHASCVCLHGFVGATCQQSAMASTISTIVTQPSTLELLQSSTKVPPNTTVGTLVYLTSSTPASLTSTSSHLQEMCQDKPCLHSVCRRPSICWQGKCLHGPLLDNGTPCVLSGISQGTCFAGVCYPSNQPDLVNETSSCDFRFCPPLSVCQLSGACENGSCISGENVEDGTPCGVAGQCFQGRCGDTLSASDAQSICLNSTCTSRRHCWNENLCVDGICYVGGLKPNDELCTTNTSESGYCSSGRCKPFSTELCHANLCGHGDCQQVSNNSYICHCHLYYEGDNCDRLSATADWNLTVVNGSSPQTITNLSLLNHKIVEFDVNPWSNCLSTACRALHANRVCDHLCDTNDCNWDGNDCDLNSLSCEIEVYCTNNRDNNDELMCQSACNSSACGWDEGACFSSQLSDLPQLVIVFAADVSAVMLYQSSINMVVNQQLQAAVLIQSISAFVPPVIDASADSSSLASSNLTAVSFTVISLCDANGSRCFVSVQSMATFVNALVTASFNFSAPFHAVGAYVPYVPTPSSSKGLTSIVPIAVSVFGSIIAFVGLSVYVLKRKRRSRALARARAKETELDSSEYSSSVRSDQYVDHDQQVEMLTHIRKMNKSSSDPELDQSSLGESAGLPFLRPAAMSSTDEHGSDTLGSEEEARKALSLWQVEEVTESYTDDILVGKQAFELESIESEPLSDISWKRVLRRLVEEPIEPAAQTTFGIEEDVMLTSTSRHRVSKTITKTELPMEAVGSLDEDCTAANVNAHDEFGNTRLILAAAEGDRAALQHIVMNGPDLTVCNYAGDSALHVACRGGHASAVEYLLFIGCRINQRNQKGWTPLHEAVASKSVAVIEMLLAQGAEIDVGDLSGVRPLVTAIKLSHLSCALKLIQHGASVSERDRRQWTALHWACATGSASLLAPLVEAGSDVNAVTEKGETSMHLAAREGNVDCVAFLIDRHARKGESDDLGKTARDYALDRGFDVIVAMIDDLSRLGGPPRPLLNYRVSPHPAPPPLAPLAPKPLNPGRKLRVLAPAPVKVQPIALSLQPAASSRSDSASARTASAITSHESSVS